MAWEENSCICLNMQLIAILSRIGVQVTRGASLSGEYYATQGNYIRLTCGNFDYRNNCFKENQSKDNIYYVGDFKEEFLLEKGDIITPLTEQAIGLLGSTARIPESGKYIQSQDIAKIDCNENLLDKDFAFYLISSACVKQQLSGSPDISRGKLFDFYRKFIPLHHEQSRIISIGTVDTAIRDTFKF